MDNNKDAPAEQQAGKPVAKPSDSVATVPAMDTEQLTQTPNWGQGGRYIINKKGERVLAPDQE